jgi:hypothetical protein
VCFGCSLGQLTGLRQGSTTIPRQRESSSSVQKEKLCVPLRALRLCVKKTVRSA